MKHTLALRPLPWLMEDLSLADEARFLPSMMDMCTALRRVRGTLLRRGPWVMDGQLLLGTSPALRRQTQIHKTSLHRETRQEEVTHTAASRCCWYNDIYSSLVPKKNGGKWKKDVIENILTSPEFTTLPVYFWRFAFDFGTLLHHLFCHSSTVIKHRDDAQDEFNIHTRAHTRTQPGTLVSPNAMKAISAVDEYSSWASWLN